MRVQCRRTKREIARIELIDIHADVIRAAETDVIAARSHVVHRERHVPGQLTLQVHGELLNPWRRPILVDETDVAVKVGQGAAAVP